MRARRSEKNKVPSTAHLGAGERREDRRRAGVAELVPAERELPQAGELAEERRDARGPVPAEAVPRSCPVVFPLVFFVPIKRCFEYRYTGTYISRTGVCLPNVSFNITIVSGFLQFIWKLQQNRGV